MRTEVLICAATVAVGAITSMAAFVPGTFYFDNGTPSNSSLSATSGGAYFISGVELSGSNPHNFYGTVVANGVTLASNILLDVGGNGELLADSDASFAVAGVPGGLCRHLYRNRVGRPERQRHLHRG